MIAVLEGLVWDAIQRSHHASSAAVRVPDVSVGGIPRGTSDERRWSDDIHDASLREAEDRQAQVHIQSLRPPLFEASVPLPPVS